MRNQPAPKKAQTRLEQLLEDVRTGAILDLDEVPEDDLALLKKHMTPAEFESLLDDLREADEKRAQS